MRRHTREKTKRKLRLPKENEYRSRIANLQTHLVEKGLNGMILVPGPNLAYYTGVHSFLLERPFLFFIPKASKPRLVAPKLESGPYLRISEDISVHSWTDNEGPSDSLRQVSEELPLEGKWGVEGRLPFLYIDSLMRHAKPDLENGEPLLQSIRELKHDSEIKLLKKAARILSKSFMNVPHLMKPGLTELQLAQAFRETIYSNGADSVDDVLVQSGPFAADSHHLPSNRKLKRNEGVVIDVSCTHSGYFADITRTFILGKDEKFGRVYEKVREANEAAIDESRSGRTVGAVDHSARSVLERNGLGSYFTHRTGHGLGLEIHEAPYIVADGDEPLQPTMVYTIEPGAYIPGKMGVRIEDDVLATSGRCEVLTRSLPRDYGWWKR
jgi:Xaa-Pro dipeptidase